MNTPIPFPGNGQSVPIVGQAFEFVSWWPTVLVTCKCTPNGTLIPLVGLGESMCTSCRKIYRVNVLEYNRELNKLNVQLGMGIPTTPASV